MVALERDITVMMADDRRDGIANPRIGDLLSETVNVLGMVEMQALDAVNRTLVEEAIKQVHDKEKGSWVLCRALIKAANDGDSPVPAKQAGFIVLKDEMTCVFYCNNLMSTPSKQIMEPDEDAIRCVHGVVSMDGWMKTEFEDNIKNQIPAVMAAYKTLKAGINHAERIKSHGMIDSESFDPQKNITLVLDSISHQTFLVMRTPTPSGKQPLIHTVHDLNRSIGDVFSQISKNITKIPSQTNNQRAPEQQSSVLSRHTEHFLFESEGGRHSQCYLCKHLRADGKRSSSIYSCSACQHAFHVNCFTMFHHYNELRQDRPELFQAIRKLHTSHGRGQGKRRDRKFKKTVTFSSAKLPFDCKEQVDAPK